MDMETMERKQLLRMVLSFVLPPVLMILLFTGAIGISIIPSTEDALMQKKKDTVRAVVHSATSLLEKHAELERQGRFSLQEAQQLALAEMRALRYGEDNKEYIWITDQQPKMLMHPFFPELEGTMLEDYSDSQGKRLFLEAKTIISDQGAGYIDYMWSKGRNAEKTVAKLSYVKLLEPWGWIVGSGIYLDDVEREIRSFTVRLLIISGLIGAVVLLLLLFMVHRGWKSETGRYLAEKELIQSHEKYQALAHASEEMIFLVIEGAVAGANRKACNNLEMQESDLIGRQFSELITDQSGHALISSVTAGESAAPTEAMIQGTSAALRIMLSAEHAVVHDRPAILFTGSPLHQAQLQSDFPAILDLLQQCGFGIVFVDSPQSGRIVQTNQTAITLLRGSDTESLAGKTLTTLLTDGDWQRMALQLIAEKRITAMQVTPTDRKNERILTWAVILEPEKAHRGRIAMIALDNSEAERKMRAVQNLLAAFLAPERLLSISLDTGKDSFALPDKDMHFLHTVTLIRQSLKTGLLAERATEIATRTTDVIFREGVAQALETLGPPPCSFAFLVLGSLGRCEPLLQPDQDSAIIYADGKDDVAQKEYFRSMGVLVTRFGATAGLPPCDAGNSAENPEWCLNETAWHRLFTSYVQDASPEDLLKVNILFDFRTVAGDETFSKNLRRHIFAEVSTRPIFLYFLAKSTLDFRLPSDFLGRLRAEGPDGNSINLKGTMLHFVNFVRIYALRHGIAATNTVARLKALDAAGNLPSDILEDTLCSWKYLLQMRLKAQVSAQDKNFPQQNIIFPNELTSWDRTMLKMAAAQVGNLQRRLSTDFVNRT
jgi:hypothetical protein